MNPEPPAPAAPRTDERVRQCVVCSADVQPGDEACPACREPALRWCKCLREIRIDERECPACGRVAPRYPTLVARAKVRRQRLMIIAALIVVPVAALAVAFGPGLLAISDMASRRSAGLAAEAEGRPADAVDHLRAWVRANPTDAEALAALGRAALATGDPDGAAELERALAEDPATPGVHVALAEHFVGTGDLRSALDHANAAPEAKARLIAARAAQRLGLDEDAARAFDRAVDAFPDDTDVAAEAAAAHATAATSGPFGNTHVERSRALWTSVAARLRAEAPAGNGGPRASLLARALAGAGDPGAAAAFTNALALAPADHALRADAHRALVAAGDLRGARAILDDPAAGDSPAWKIARARELLSYGALVASGQVDAATARAAAEEAVASARASIAAGSQDIEAVIVLVRALTALGRTADAQAAVEPALRLATAQQPALYAAAGDAALAAGDTATAARRYSSWRVMAPSDPAPLRRLVALGIDELITIRRSAANGIDARTPLAATAERALADLRTLVPDDDELLRWEAILCDASGQHREADRAIAKLLQRRPRDPAARALRIRRACDGTGRPDATHLATTAPPDGLDGADTDPADVRLFCTLALAAGRADLVEPLAERAIARLRDDAGLRRSLATARIALCRFDEAAAGLDPADPVVARDEDLVELRITARALAGRVESLDAEFVAAGALGAGRPGGPILGAGFAVAGDVERARELLAPRTPDDGAAPETPARRRTRAERLEDAGLPAVALPLWMSLADDPASDGPLHARALASVLDGTAPDDPGGTALRQRATETARHLAGGSATDRAASVYLTAVIAAREGDQDGAAALFRRSAAAHPGLLDSNLRLGRALAHLGRPAEAAEAFAAHLVVRPADAPARRLFTEQLAATAMRGIATGDLQSARAAARAARRHAAPEFDAAARTARRASSGLLGFGVPRPALDGLAASPPRTASDAPAAAAYAVMLAEGGRTAEAMAIAEELLVADLDRNGSWVVRGSVRLAGGDTAGALEDFAEAHRRGERSAEFRTTRALAFFLAGRRAEALTEIGAALDQAPADGFAATVASALGGTAVNDVGRRAADEEWAAELRAAAER